MMGPFSYSIVLAVLHHTGGLHSQQLYLEVRTLV